LTIQRKLSYSTARKTLLSALKTLGLNKTNVGLHSLRSGGSTAAAAAGVEDRLFKTNMDDGNLTRVCSNFRKTKKGARIKSKNHSMKIITYKLYETRNFKFLRF
jgi:hypothetical protein